MIRYCLLLMGLACGMAITRAVTTVTIPSSVAVCGEQMLLGDVATIDGDERACASLAAVLLGPTPVAGQRRELSAAQIRVRLRQHGVALEEITLVCPAVIIITRAMKILRGEAIVAAARAWLDSRVAGTAEKVVLTPVRPPADCPVPEGELTWQCSALQEVAGTTRAVQVVALVQGQPAWQGTVSFRVQRLVPVLVAAAPIARGEILTPTLVIRDVRDIAALQSMPVQQLEQLAGCRASEAISAGSILTTRMIEVIPVVKRNDQVRVIALCGALRITLRAVAGEDGVTGAIIRVRNPQTQQEFSARVVGPGALELMP